MGICVSCRRRELQAPDKRAGGAGGGRLPSKGVAAELLPRRVDPAMANSISNIKMTNPIKGIVSKRRKRYIKDGFNLDLAYITDRLIAMGFPAEKLEGVYRNHIDEVFRFLEQMHKDHYKIYNLCSERCYDSSKFHGRVARYAFEDHTPPKMEIIQPFCEDVHTWLSEDPRNVAAVHCKAGKGRTGTMMCCYLLYSGQKATADEALKFYGTKRTHDEKGVTIPSQRRYVEYYAALVRNGLHYSATKLHIRELVMSPPPSLNGGQCTLELTVSQATPPLKAPSGCHEVRKHDSHIRMVLAQCTPLLGDVRVDVYNKPKMMMRKERLFHFWFNTFFVANGVGASRVHPPPDSMNLDTFKLTLNKWQLDDAHKDKLHKLYSADFKVEVILQQQPESSRFLASGRAPSPCSSSSCSDQDPDSEHWDSGEHNIQTNIHYCNTQYHRLNSEVGENGDKNTRSSNTLYLRLNSALEDSDSTGDKEMNRQYLRLNSDLSDDGEGMSKNTRISNHEYLNLTSDGSLNEGTKYEGNCNCAAFKESVSPRCMQVEEYELLKSPLDTLNEVCPHGCVNETISEKLRNSQTGELCPHGYGIVSKVIWYPTADDLSKRNEALSDCTEKLDIDYGDIQRLCSKSTRNISYALSDNADIDMTSCNNCIQMDFTQNPHKLKGKVKGKSLQTSPIKTMENAGMLTKDGYMLIDRTPRLQKEGLMRVSDPSHAKKHSEISEKCMRISDPTDSRKCRHAGMVSKDGYMLIDATSRQPTILRRNQNTSTEGLGLPVVHMRLKSEPLAEDYLEFTAADGCTKPVDRETKVTNYAEEYAYICPDAADDKTGLCEARNCTIVTGLSDKDEGTSEACGTTTSSKSEKNKKHTFFKRDDYKNEKGKIPKVSSDHTISDECKKKYNFFLRRDEEGSKPKFAFGDMRASWREFSGKFTDNRKKKDRDD